MAVLNLGITHRGFFGLAKRGLRILDRYGLSPKKAESSLRHYVEIMQRHGITATFPIVAKVLNRHAEMVKSFQNNGVEFAVHGYDHRDFTRLSREEILEQMEKAVEVFRRNNIQFFGFRFPYLRWNLKCVEALANCSFKWDSSFTILWDVVDNTLFSERDIRNYQHMLDQYNSKSSSNCLSLPKLRNNVLEIPVSLPDDDLLERLGLKDSKAVGEIWDDVLRQTHSRGEVFTLQLHPERIFMLGDSLESIIRNAKGLHPRVWITSLGDICEWWKEKKLFAIKLNNKGNSEFEVEADCSPRATLLVRSDCIENEDFYGYSVREQRKLCIRSQKRPVVGIPEDSSPELIHFLRNEGFIFEMSEEKQKYSVYLDNPTDFSEKDEMKALEIIHANNLPLIRFWRWPDGCKSCLSVTGDIDSMTLFDFFDR